MYYDFVPLVSSTCEWINQCSGVSFDTSLYCTAIILYIYLLSVGRTLHVACDDTDFHLPFLVFILFLVAFCTHFGVHLRVGTLRSPPIATGALHLVSGEAGFTSSHIPLRSPSPPSFPPPDMTGHSHPVGLPSSTATPVAPTGQLFADLFPPMASAPASPTRMERSMHVSRPVPLGPKMKPHLLRK